MDSTTQRDSSHDRRPVADDNTRSSDQSTSSLPPTPDVIIMHPESSGGLSQSAPTGSVKCMTPPGGYIGMPVNMTSSHHRIPKTLDVPSEVPTIQPPAAAMTKPQSRLDRPVTDTGVTEAEGPDLNSIEASVRAGRFERPLAYDYSYAHSRGGGRNSTRMSREAPAIGKTVGERLQPTLEHAEEAREAASVTATRTSYALNIAIGAQVVLGAFTTGIAASGSSKAGIVTAVLGGILTLAASYLARMRGSGEPEASALRCKELANFIRNCEAFILDHGHVVIVENDTDELHIQLEGYIRRFRAMFEEIMGNNADDHVSSGTGSLVVQSRKSKSLA